MARVAVGDVVDAALRIVLQGADARGPAGAVVGYPDIVAASFTSIGVSLVVDPAHRSVNGWADAERPDRTDPRVSDAGIGASCHTRVAVGDVVVAALRVVFSGADAAREALARVGDGGVSAEGKAGVGVSAAV